MATNITGKDVLDAVGSGPEGLPYGDDAESRTYSQGVGEILMDLRRHAGGKYTVLDVPLNEDDLTKIIDDAVLCIESTGLHEVDGPVGEGIRSARDRLVTALRSLLQQA